jgi:hypothetical protein
MLSLHNIYYNIWLESATCFDRYPAIIRSTYQGVDDNNIWVGASENSQRLLFIILCCHYTTYIITTGYSLLHVSTVTLPSSGQQGIVLIKVLSLAFSVRSHYLQEVGCGYIYWIGLAQGTDRWRTVVSAVMNLRVPWNAGNFLTSCKPVSCSRRTLHRGVSGIPLFALKIFKLMRLVIMIKMLLEILSQCFK